MKFRAGTARSLRPDDRKCNQLRPLLGFIGNELAKVGGGSLVIIGEGRECEGGRSLPISMPIMAIAALSF